MLTLIFGIILGWLIPRPRWVASIEIKLLGGIKNKLPNKYRWW